jgi:hypothetical protein
MWRLATIENQVGDDRSCEWCEQESAPVVPGRVYEVRRLSGPADHRQSVARRWTQADSNAIEASSARHGQQTARCVQ